MTSKLAKAQVESWWAEGLRPTVEDIVLVNNLGLQVERGSEMFAFGACPRVAFLGDNVLREPTVAKRLWIDQASMLFADTPETRIYVLAYALGTGDADLPGLSDKRKIQAGVVKFRDEVLLNYTDTQILAAVDYALNGNRPDLDLPPDASDAEKAEKKSLEEVYDVPCEDQSMAKQLLLQALAEKIPAEAAQYALLDDLERMTLAAAMHDHAGVLKNQHAKAAGRFYVAAGRIRERLMKEKENGKG